MKSLLDRIFASLQDVFESIDSADYGGTPAYNAFLKGVDPDDVKSFFEKIAKGVYIQIPGDQSAAPPGMLCVDSSQKELYDLFCRGARLGGSTGFGAAICPSFFDLPVIPTFDMCPGLIVRGSAFGAAPALIQTQQTILQTVFIETYLNDQTRGHVLNPVVEDLNSVRTLSPAQARINYPNYAWYLDCRFSKLPSRLTFALVQVPLLHRMSRSHILTIQLPCSHGRGMQAVPQFCPNYAPFNRDRWNPDDRSRGKRTTSTRMP